MKRNDENIKVLTKEDIIKLSNTVKMQEFLNDYKSWGVWLDIEAIDVQLYKALFPDNTCIFVTEYPSYLMKLQTLKQLYSGLVLMTVNTELMPTACFRASINSKT